ncbi:MAG: prepilin-type N-terminal cleavage/methylation domain-containing protein [Firmicutes bacterium]|nr:prepilin-type N-terminal cleavage/methylation domain-containing protein [Bacillota bacterium]
MKKKGFTLIELLAVIVVLAIIALIATLIVMNVISNASKGAAERSADNYIKAVETLIATERLEGNKIADGTYTIGTDGNLQFETVELSGIKPSGGTITIKDGQVVKEKTSIIVGNYTVTFENGNAKAKELAKLDDLCNLEVVTHEVGAEYTCDLGDGHNRIFYVLEAGTSSRPATLILENNFDTGGSHGWTGVEQTLYDISMAWPKLDRSQIGVPSVEQIMVADGKAADAYLNNESEDVHLENDWLYDFQERVGYWTSSLDGYDGAWLIFSNGEVGTAPLTDKHEVRPVIRLAL